MAVFFSHSGVMNKLPVETRVQILSMLCEGSSMRSISRITGVSINTVSKLLIDAGMACAAFHDAKVRNVPAKAVQCDEIWSFNFCRVHKTLGATPAMAAGLVDKVLEKLKGDRDGYRSVRVNEKYRIVFSLDETTRPPTVTIIAIEDYH